MSVLQQQTLSPNSVKIRYEEQYVSAGLNYKLLKSIGRGILCGFICQPGVAGGLWLDIAGDSVSGVSACCLEVSVGGTYAMHVVLQQTYSFNLVAQASSTVYVVVDVQYSPGSTTAGQLKVVQAADLAANPQFVVLAQVVVPASGPIPTANINWAYGTYSGDNQSAFVPQKLNLLHNPGFEKDRLASSQPSSWSLVPGAATITVDNAVAHTGTQSLKITSASSTTAYAYSGMLPVDVGATYYASTWLVSTGSSPIAGTGVQVYVQFFTGVGAAVGSPIPVGSAFTGGSTTWVQSMTMVTAPATAQYARIYIAYAASAGTIWVDDVEFSTRFTAHTWLKSNRKDVGGLTLPLALFPTPDNVQPSGGPVKLQLQWADWSPASAFVPTLQWAAAPVSGDFPTTPTGAGNGILHYFGYDSSLYLHSTGSFTIGGLESGDPNVYVQLNVVGGQGRLVLEHPSMSRSVDFTCDDAYTLTADQDASALHYHDGTSTNYSGGASWLNGVTNPATTTDDQFNHIVSVLSSEVSSTSGADAVGYEGHASGTYITALAAASVGVTFGNLLSALETSFGSVYTSIAACAASSASLVANNTLTGTQTNNANSSNPAVTTKNAGSGDGEHIDVSGGSGYAQSIVPNATSGSMNDSGLTTPPTNKTIGTPDTDTNRKSWFDPRIGVERRWDSVTGLWTHTPIVANNAQATTYGVNQTLPVGSFPAGGTFHTTANSLTALGFPPSGFFYAAINGGGSGPVQEVHYTSITNASGASTFNGCTGGSGVVFNGITIYANPPGYRSSWYGASNPWADYASAPGGVATPLIWWKDNEGVVFFEGGTLPGGSSSTTVLGTPLPAGFKPVSGVIFSGSPGTNFLSVDPASGNIYASNATYALWLSGLSYRSA